MSLLKFCVSYLEKYLFRSFTRFSNIFIYLFGLTRSQLWRVGSSALTTDQSMQAPCTGSSEC